MRSVISGCPERERESERDEEPGLAIKPTAALQRRARPRGLKGVRVGLAGGKAGEAGKKRLLERGER